MSLGKHCPSIMCKWIAVILPLSTFVFLKYLFFICLYFFFFFFFLLLSFDLLLLSQNLHVAEELSNPFSSTSGKGLSIFQG